MSLKKRSALVLQGGGALGAYELGAARRLYKDAAFAPDIIAGVSIGAITAALLARPAKGMKPLEALEEFWREVTVSGWFLPPPFQQYASIFGNPNFYRPRMDYLDIPSWTSIYDTAPLRQTLARLVDCKALADKSASPTLLVSATDIEGGQIEYFASRTCSLSLDHIVASGSLPPSFDMTGIAGKSYWDGGLFDNTPLGPVIDLLNDGRDIDTTIYVVNLFPNKAELPQTMSQVVERMLNLQFANRTEQDVKLMTRFNEVVDLMQTIARASGSEAIKSSDAYKTLLGRKYTKVPNIVQITRPEEAASYDGSDFSAPAISRRADEGYRQTDQALRPG
jgi:predicted acylesterase/phospholipase RssA